MSEENQTHEPWMAVYDGQAFEGRGGWTIKSVEKLGGPGIYEFKVAETHIAAVAARIVSLSDENQRLRQELESVKASATSTPAANSIEVEIVCNGEVHYRRPWNDQMVQLALKTPGYSIHIHGIDADKIHIVKYGTQRGEETRQEAKPFDEFRFKADLFEAIHTGFGFITPKSAEILSDTAFEILKHWNFVPNEYSPKLKEI